MGRTALVVIGGTLIVLAIVANFTLFVVKETEQALVLQFGNPIGVIQEPGLEVKWPFVQNVQFFEDRLLAYEPPTEEVILGDTRRLQVSTAILYRITDPLEFYQRVRDERGVIDRLRAANSSTLRSVLAEVSQARVLSEFRGQLMVDILNEMRVQVQRLGIALVDVRILRAELPEQNTQRVLERMQSEREQEARLIRSEGEQAATEMRADADLQQAELVANAQREAQQIRGEADNYGLATLANAYAQDEAFFRFYYRLTRYGDALSEETTTMYMGADSHFLQLLNGQDFNLGSGIRDVGSTDLLERRGDPADMEPGEILEDMGFDDAEGTPTVPGEAAEPLPGEDAEGGAESGLDDLLPQEDVGPEEPEAGLGPDEPEAADDSVVPEDSALPDELMPEELLLDE